MKVQIQEYITKGYNKTQTTSLAWADHFQDFMDKNDWKSQGFFGVEVRIDCYCFTCKKGGQFLSSTTRDFIHMHKDHSTKTLKFR